jgi:hypothetical protein
MEALLSVAFDNLSCYDGGKIKKGLRQVDGLLAQICLSQSQQASPKSPVKKSSSSSQQPDGTQQQRPKPLPTLSSDPAFREFFKLQEGFEWNVAQRLLITLDRLVAKGGDGQNDMLILSALDLIQGTLLLHPPSKALFSREQYMNVCSLPPLPPTPDETHTANGCCWDLAPARSNRTGQLPGHPMRHPPHPRGGSDRHAYQYTHL